MAQEQEQECVPASGVIANILSPDGDKHIEWMKIVFGAQAEEKDIHRDEHTKKIQHGSVKLNGGVIYISDGSCLPEQAEQSLLPPGAKPLGTVMHLNVKEPDARAIWERAIDNGAKTVVELKTQFWGGIYGTFRDVFGYEWAVCASSKSTAEEKETTQSQV